MRPVLTTKTVIGQQNYNFGFDYLSKEFIRVIIDNTELNYPDDYSVNGTTVTLKLRPNEVKPMIIYRETSTIPLVKWQDGSVMTAKNMNLQDLQTLHSNEESSVRHQEVKDWHYQTKEDRKVITEKAEEVARNTQEVIDNKTIVVYQAGNVDKNTETVRTMTASNELIKTSLETILPEIKRAHVDTLEKARTVDTQYNSVNTSRAHVDIMVQEARDILDTANEIVGGDFYTKREVDAKLEQEATQAIANIVNNAPSVLNTLQELASALNNDPNFATTMTNLIGTKATLQQVYPVGSIYLSTVATNPNTLFGFGTWEHVEAGRFLLAQGGKYANGSKGGSETHQLTASEMPTHNHYGSTHQSGGHTHTGSTAGVGAHSHGVLKWKAGNKGNTIKRRVDVSNTGFKSSDVLERALNAVEDSPERNLLTNEGDHSHTISLNSGGDHAHAIKNDGGSAAHNNMPPYLAVYIWERIN